MLKRCSHCKQLLDESQFNWKIKSFRLATNCRRCSREYVRNHYYKNKTYYLEKAKKTNKQLRELSIEYIGTYLQKHPCVDCGERNILVLEFDHKDRNLKLEDISLIIKRRLSLKKLILEIAKCDIRCANCHRRKTAIENNSWKIKFAPVA